MVKQFVTDIGSVLVYAIAKTVEHQHKPLHCSRHLEKAWNTNMTSELLKEDKRRHLENSKTVFWQRYHELEATCWSENYFFSNYWVNRMVASFEEKEKCFNPVSVRHNLNIVRYHKPIKDWDLTSGLSIALLLPTLLKIKDNFIMKERNVLKLPVLPSAAQECYQKSYPTDTFSLQRKQARGHGWWE